MACITKLANAIAYDCDTGATGLTSALIINKADIASFSISTTGSVLTLALAAGAKAYKVDTVKRTTTVSSALKINDGAPNAFTHSATLTIMGLVGLESVYATDAALSNGSFVVLAKRNPPMASQCAAYGLYYGMSVTAYDRHSHDNAGWGYVTMSTPENVIGEDNLVLPTALYDSLYETAVG